MSQCQAITSNAKRCSHSAIEGSDYCHIPSHQQQAGEDNPIFCTSFEDLKALARKMTQKRLGSAGEEIFWDIGARLDKLQILDEALRQYRESGKKLPLPFKNKLSETYYVSVKEVERLVYNKIHEGLLDQVSADTEQAA